MRLLRLLVLLCLAASLPAVASPATRQSVEEAVRRANSYYQTQYPLGTAVWNRGAYHAGNLRAYQTLRLPSDLDYSLAWAEANGWKVGPEAGGGADADAHACGQAYIDLYLIDPQPSRLASIKSALDGLVATPARSTDDWWWIDAFFMAGPTFARLSRLSDSPAYFDQMQRMYFHMKDARGLFDPARGLWYRDAKAKSLVGPHTPRFWGRGNGWVIAACARILEQLPPGDPRRSEFAAMLRTMAAALLPLQGADGFWRSNLTFPDHFPNPETSCTAFFTYALAYGVNEGLLDRATYAPVVERAWQGMVAVALQPSGRLGYVQPIGAAPADNTADSDHDYAYGAFLLAGCEIIRGLGGPAPAHPTAADFAPASRFHLTARPWRPVGDTTADLLDHLEPVVRAVSRLQYFDTANLADVNNGAIRDPYNNAEVQYSTPYFAFAAATLLARDRAPDLVVAATRAMDRCTLDISDGKATDSHGEFFVAPMMKAYRLFTALRTKFPAELTPERLALWRTRLSLPRSRFMHLNVKQNWRTYAAKGEWLRQQDGFIADGASWIEGNWTLAGEGSQRERFTRAESLGQSPALNLYHDDTGDPETFAYNGGAAGNLLDMLEAGYDGPSAAEMRRLIQRNLTACLLLMGGSGEAPAGGRTGDHVWNDVVYGNDYDLMAEIAARQGDLRLAGQFRRAARLAFRSAWRFQQESGWMSVTKSLFHPSLKNHYARYSALTNYNGYVQIHTAEALGNRRTEIPEQPAPAEIGGYALTLPDSYAHTFLNAGGMQLQLCTRGQTDNYAGVQWSTLGLVRFSRPGWDSRLGPAAGATASDFTNSAAFAPVFLENGSWVRVSQLPARYAATFTPEFAHPLLVRGTYTLAPRPGQTGPTFSMRITVTPDGALIDTARTTGAEPYGVIWPLLEFDGRTRLETAVATHTAATAYPYFNNNTAAGILQAEAATTVSGGAAIESAHPGYNGAGFANLPPAGGILEWTGVEGGPGGRTVIGFRYACGLGVASTATRTVNLTVNGATTPLTFASTGTFGDWHQLYVPVTLTPGATNTVRLASTGEDSANIDELRVHLPAPAAPEQDQQSFLALGSTHRLDASAAPMRTAYGDVRPIQVTDTAGGPLQTFVYPRSAGDPSAEAVRASFVGAGADFSSVLGRVRGDTYVGRTSAGGRASSLDLDGDGAAELTFDQTCEFIVQLTEGRPTAIETDRPVTATLSGRPLHLAAFTPAALIPDR